jgi:DNA-binding transcriptional regulator YiaG
MLLVAYIPTVDRGSLDASQRAMEAFARSQGWPNGIKSADNVTEAVPGGYALQSILGRLGRGDTLVISSLSDLGTLPSEIEKNLMAAVSSGVALHILDLGRVENSLLAIRATLGVSREIEAEYLKTRELINKMNAQHAIELEEHGQAIVERMTSVFGTRNFFKAIDKTSEVNGVGHFIRSKREAIGFSQKDLADKVGVSKSTIQRAESTGNAEDIGAILNVLTDAPTTQIQEHTR